MKHLRKIGKIIEMGLDDLCQSGHGDSQTNNQRGNVSIGYKGVRYKGPSDVIGKCARIGLTVVIIGAVGYGAYKGAKCLNNHWKERKKAKEEIKRIKTEKDARIEIINAQANADVRVAEAKAAAKAKARAQQDARQHSQQSFGESLNPDNDYCWLDEFNRNHPLPIDALPDDFATVISGYDPDIAPAMFFHLCSMYGSYCFSRVTAKKRGYEIRRPNIQVVIEALPGIGKSLFRNVHQVLFRRVIDEDKRKLNTKDDEKNFIIQTFGIDSSSARLQEILESNQGVHVYIFDSEIATATNKDLSVYLRKAFDNDDVSRERMHKGQNGSCEALLNTTLTGTGDNVETFIKRIATVEGGGASRVCWCSYPLDGDSDDSPNSLHEGPDLERMRDRIDEYRHKYVFTTDNGEDTAVDLVEIKDFDYVMSALKGWEKKQADQSKQTNNDVRKQIRWRISTIAMHIGIVMHMMIQPDGDPEKMSKVVQLVIYAAEHCMSRYLWLFGAQHNKMIQDVKNRERVPRQGSPTPYYSRATKDEDLEQRRADVIRLFHEGKIPHEIAEELVLHDTQVHRILDKEGLKRK